MTRYIMPFLNTLASNSWISLQSLSDSEKSEFQLVGVEEAEETPDTDAGAVFVF